MEVFFGGEKRHEELAAVSAVIGRRDSWHHVRHADGSKSRQPDTELLMPPEALHALAERKAVILAPACRAILADTPAIWERPGHARADLSDMIPVRESLAIEAPRREAIPMPPAAPAAIPQPAPVPALGSPAGAAAVADYTPAIPEEESWPAKTRL